MALEDSPGEYIVQRRFKISVDGQAYDVTVEEVLTGPGNLYPDRGTMTAAPVNPDSSTALAPTPVNAAARAAGPGDVVSPLAGVVVSVDVALGSTVTEGARVVTLEAMKTKTVVTAGRAGTVNAIAVAPGDPVEAGQPLLTIA